MSGDVVVLLTAIAVLVAAVAGAISVAWWLWERGGERQPSRDREG
jgi:hypothetical protein